MWPDFHFFGLDFYVIANSEEEIKLTNSLYYGFFVYKVRFCAKMTCS